MPKQPVAVQPPMPRTTFKAFSEHLDAADAGVLPRFHTVDV